MRSMGVHRHGDLGRDSPSRPRRRPEQAPPAAYNIHWDTLKKILEHAEPPGYRRTVPRPRPTLDPFLPVIHQIIKDDKKAPGSSDTPPAASSSGSATNTATPAA